MHRDGDKPISIGQVIAPPCSNDIFIACEDSAQMRTLICEICDRFREIVLLYEKGILPGQQGFYPINQIAACIRLSKFLYQMRKHRFNNVVSGKLSKLFLTLKPPLTPFSPLPPFPFRRCKFSVSTHRN